MPDQLISVLIIDDDEHMALILQAFLENLHYAIAGVATTKSQALAIFNHQPVDLIVVNTSQSDHQNALLIARQLEALRSLPIIVLTSQPVIEPIVCNSMITYLTKPVAAGTMQLSIDAALIGFAKQSSDRNPALRYDHTRETILQINDLLFIKENYQFIRLSLPDLLYLHADASYTTLVTTTRKHVLRLTLHTLLERLACDSLVRVHRSYAVNINQIDFFSNDEISLGGQRIPLGRSYKDLFLQQFIVR